MKFTGQVFYHFELQEYVVITKFDGCSLSYYGEMQLFGHCSIDTIAGILGPVSVNSLTPLERDTLLTKLCMFSDKSSLLDGTDLIQFTNMDL